MRRRLPGLVDEVDGLVGKVTITDVAIGEVGRRDERLIGDGDPVVGLVLVADALEDLDRVRHGGLVDLDRLEATLECRVLLEVLAVLVGGGGTDGLQLATSEHRLEDRRRVDGAFGRARADERVDLVDEEHDVAARLDLLEHLLEALFEVAAVTAAGDECTEVERVQLLVAQRVGDVVGDDLLRQAFDDGGLADTRLTDEHRVVLGATAEDLHHPLELARPTDDRIELLLASELGEVAPELIEDLAVALVAGILLAGGTGACGCGLRLARLALTTLVAGQQLDHLLTHAAEIGPELDEHLCRDALAFADETEQDVLGADVVVTELQRFAQRQLEHLLGTRCEGDVTGRRRAALTDDLFDLAAHRFERDAERFHRFCSDAFAFVDESEQDVFRPDVAVIEQPRFFLRKNNDPPSPISEAFEHARPFENGGYLCAVYRGARSESRRSRFQFPGGNTWSAGLTRWARGGRCSMPRGRPAQRHRARRGAARWS